MDVTMISLRHLQMAGGHQFAEVVDVAQMLPLEQVIDSDWTVRCRVISDQVVTALAHRGNVFVLVRSGPGRTAVECATSTAESADQVAKEFRLKLASLLVEPNPRKTRVRMWSMGASRGQLYIKTIATIPWSENRDNYPRRVAVTLDELVRFHNPDVLPGKVILWHGEPGTGKTSAIRALIHEWREWCTAHRVIDPEKFFFDPTYIAEVLSCPDPKPWKLLIAEDCDEYLVRQTGGVAGALGRLLNLTDGLFGQGSNTMVLLTTNASLG